MIKSIMYSCANKNLQQHFQKLLAVGVQLDPPQKAGDIQAGGHLHVFKMRFLHTKSESNSPRGRCTKSLWGYSQLTAAHKCPQQNALGSSSYPRAPCATPGLDRAVTRAELAQAQPRFLRSPQLWHTSAHLFSNQKCKF